MRRYLLHEFSWKDVSSFDRSSTVFLLPVGSVEQHGPHLPLGTDFLIAESIAQSAASKCDNAICLPTLPFGCSKHHRDFAGTLWVSPFTLETIIKDLLGSLLFHGFRKVIVVNGHGGNTSSIFNAISEYNDEHDMLCLLMEWWKDPDIISRVFGSSVALHADAVETSVLWSAHPSLVHTDLLSSLTSSSRWGREIGGLPLPSRTAQFTDSGIAGTVTGISQDKGAEVFCMSVEKLVQAINALSSY